jgi:hypothetical protein
MGFFSVDLIVVAGGAFCAAAAGPVKEPVISSSPVLTGEDDRMSRVGGTKA